MRFNVQSWFTGLTPLNVYEFSLQTNFPVNAGLILCNSSKNPIVKKLSVSLRTADTLRVVKYFDARFRILNRDGSINRINAGNIINPLSGPWNGTNLKNSDIDIVLSSKKNFIEFDEGVIFGGFQLISISVQFYPNTGILASGISINTQLDYE